MKSRAQIRAKILELDQEIQGLSEGKKKVTGDEPVIQQRAALMWVIDDGE